MSYNAGGGRTLRAKGTKRSSADTGASLRTNTGVNSTFCRFAVALGAAVWAATQTVHFDSLLLEWWCAATATADQSVSRRQTTATHLTADRIFFPHRVL